MSNVRALTADAGSFMAITGRPRSGRKIPRSCLRGLPLPPMGRSARTRTARKRACAVRSNMRYRALQQRAPNPNPNLMKIYKRLDRAVANAALIGVVLASLHFFRDESLLVGLLSAVVMASAIVTYGFFIASQHCPKCHESFVGRHPKRGLGSVLLVFHVPSQCPHCGARAQW